MSSRPSANSNKKMDNHFEGNGSMSPNVASFSGLSADPLEEISKIGISGSTKVNGQAAKNKGSYDDLDPFDIFRKSMRALSTEKNNRVKDRSLLRADSSTDDRNKFSSRSSGSHSVGTTPVEKVHESQQTFSKISMFSSFTSQATGENASSPSYENGNSTETNIPADDVEPSHEIWLTVSEIPLFTQPTASPPPTRPPPPHPVRASKVASSSYGSRNDGLSNEELSMNSDAAASAAAMKEAMERAEAKFRHAKEMWRRENSWAARSRENVQLEKGESGEDFFRGKQERLERQKEEEEKKHRKLEKEREREEKEREQRRLEKERARQAVERATREACERAAAEAQLRAERAAVEKAQAEFRERAERATVQRAQAEARERVANEAKERAQRAAVEPRNRESCKKASEGRMQAERAAVDRAAIEARERAAREARGKATAASAVSAAWTSQQKHANDLDFFFNMGSQTPKPRTSALDPASGAQFQSREGPGAVRTSGTTQSSNTKKADSTANILDDLTSIFSGKGAASSREFQEVEGETEERRRARLERHQRTQERAARALAEKNLRDLQTQREQEERHRIAETLDIEIKRWAAGKEGNLRALLSTLQYVLWPECGWQPASLTDLITAAAVKKVYRKATLCIHPDKVQQKGANLQQKYIAEKVFDLLKEAWNKCNSEELF